MASRIAFLSRVPPLSIFSKHFGIEYLSQKGFEIFFLDVSCLIDGLDAQYLYQEQTPLPNCETHAIQQLDELEAFVKESFENTIFIDFVSGLSEYNQKTGQVFKILKRYNAKYYVISNGDIPSFHFNDYATTSAFLIKIKKALKNPRLLLNLLTRKLIVHLIKLDILYQKPHRIFGMEDSPAVIAYLEKFRMSGSVITPINSRDYDLYLEYIRNNSKKIISEESCVFLDEDLTNHPDFSLFGITPLNKEKYSLSMNHFFEHVEKRTGLTVVIAAHPKSKFSAKNHPYGDRAFIQGNTVQLVAKSKMVVAHASTSISFPVLFCKPIVLAITNEMKKRIDMMNNVQAFAKALGVTPINVDTLNELGKYDIEFEGRSDYKDYLHKYIKNKVPINKLTWEIVADAALND